MLLYILYNTIERGTTTVRCNLIWLFIWIEVAIGEVLNFTTSSSKQELNFSKDLKIIKSQLQHADIVWA